MCKKISLCSSKWCDPEMFMEWAPSHCHSPAHFQYWLNISWGRNRISPHWWQQVLQKPAPAEQSPSVFLLSSKGFKRSFEICLLICFPLMAATEKSFQPEKVKLSQTILVHSKHTNWLFFKNQKLTICFEFRSGITYSKVALALNHSLSVHGCACAGVGMCMC